MKNPKLIIENQPWIYVANRIESPRLHSSRVSGQWFLWCASQSDLFSINAANDFFLYNKDGPVNCFPVVELALYSHWIFAVGSQLLTVFCIWFPRSFPSYFPELLTAYLKDNQYVIIIYRRKHNKCPVTESTWEFFHPPSTNPTQTRYRINSYKWLIMEANWHKMVVGSINNVLQCHYI
jgi:hypothetical protein